MTSVSASWTRILAWLQAHAPDALEEQEPSPSSDQIDDAAVEMGVEFPSELREFYDNADGIPECGVFPSHDEWDEMAFSPMPLAASR